jgi:hypothetical protein
MVSWFGYLREAWHVLGMRRILCIIVYGLEEEVT